MHMGNMGTGRCSLPIKEMKIAMLFSKSVCCFAVLEFIEFLAIFPQLSFSLSAQALLIPKVAMLSSP